jgi:hypothetical protein
MATTTPNFGWAVPTSTDLVKDGAVAIETLGDSIDASLVDLKGGTTGQVLTKASGTDMDFSWTAVDPLVILDAKGDLITATAADTPARLAVGTNGHILTADSTAATGLKWAAPAAAGKVLQVVNAIYSTPTTSTSSTFADTGLTATITPTSATSKVMVFVTIPVYKDFTNTAGEFKVFRAATEITRLANVGYNASTNGIDVGTTSINYLDSPATTSATIYKVQFASAANSNRIVINREFTTSGDNRSSITLMEIGA